MIAAAMGDMTTVLALLRMPGVDRRVACAHGKDAVDYAVQYGKKDQIRPYDRRGTFLAWTKWTGGAAQLELSIATPYHSVQECNNRFVLTVVSAYTVLVISDRVVFFFSILLRLNI